MTTQNTRVCISGTLSPLSIYDPVRLRTRDYYTVSFSCC